MMKMYVFKKCVILFCIAFLMVGITSYANDNQIQVEYLSTEKEELEDNQNKIAAIEKEKEAMLSEGDQMEMDLNHIFESIEELDETVTETETEYKNKTVSFKIKLLINFFGSINTVFQLFVAPDITHTWTNLESYYDITIENNRCLRNELLGLEEDLKSKKAMQSENPVLLKTLINDKEILVSQLGNTNVNLSNVSKTTQEMIAALRAMEDEMVQASETIAETIRTEQEKVQDDGSTVENKLLWPVTSSQYVSSYFGMRMHPVYNYMRMHNGIDIAAAGGTDILAAESGTVLISEWQTNGGYGQYVVIDHGDGISTVYAHVSKLTVRAGQKVERGDTIALVGTTGNSFTNHLHFEVRIDGTPVNPVDYL